MLQHALSRLWQSIFVLVGASLAIFALSYLSGDPVYALIPFDADVQVVEITRKQFGLDQPLHVQYLIFVEQALQGDLGNSFKYRTSAVTIVLDRLPATLTLALSSILLSVAVAVPLGILCATRREGIWDYVGRIVSTLTIAIPPFWLGIILILIFADQLRWLPASGRGSIQHLVLPAVTMSAFNIGLITRLVRSGMIEELRRDYVRTARAKGLPEGAVRVRHALKNAMIPVVTVVGLRLGALMGGSVIVETVFAWPGLGWLLMQSISGRDLPVIRAGVLIMAGIFVFINLVVDLSYSFIDPRIRYH